MNNSDSSRYRKERFVWAAVTVFLTACLAVVFFSPSVIAQSKQAETDRQLNDFEYVFRFIQQNYVDEKTPEQLMEGAMKGLFGSLEDPHSAYLDEQAMRSLNDTTSGEFGGVGIYISKPEPDTVTLPEGEHSWVEVVAPIEGTPAFKAGINAGDFITQISGETTEPLTSDEVVKKLRGAPGSEVVVTILRGEGTPFDVKLRREIIKVPTVKYSMIPGGIGYIRIIQFTPLTPQDVKGALEDLSRKGYSKLVIDLRSNPGGLLSSVIETADLFFSNGIIVSTKSRLRSENAVFNARPGQVVADNVPMTVLIDKGSASAAEILAGALKDRNRATLIGETTYGKGSVQQVHEIQRGKTGFRLTMSKYYTPADISIDKIGVKPDIEVLEPELTEAEQTAFTSLLDKGTIDTFVKTHPNPDDPTVNAFIGQLKTEGVALSDRILKRLVKNTVNRTVNTPPVYDLEFDLVLQEALRFLQNASIGGIQK